MNNFFRIGCVVVFCLMLSSCNEGEKNVTASNNVEVSVSNASLNHVEPLNWWVGMENKNLQLLVNHPEIGLTSPEISYTGVTIKEVHKAKSPNYLFVDLEISEAAKPGKFDIRFKDKNGEVKTHTYELLERQKSSEDYKGFDSSDAIFLITPDRFANGDPANDVASDLNDSSLDRTNGYARQGGD